MKRPAEFILAFDANSALSRENETKIVKITHSGIVVVMVDVGSRSSSTFNNPFPCPLAIYGFHFSEAETNLNFGNDVGMFHFFKEYQIF